MALVGILWVSKDTSGCKIMEMTRTSFSYIHYDPPPSTARYTPSLPTERRGRLKWTVFASRFQ